MKHILNDLSEQEKNAIREQHTGGMKVMTENFYKLLNAKLGDAKPLVSEQASNPYKVGQVIKAIRDKDQKEYTIKIVNVGDYYVVAKITGPGTYKEGNTPQPLDGKVSYELTSNQPGQLSGNGEMGVFKIGGMNEQTSSVVRNVTQGALQGAGAGAAAGGTTTMGLGSIPGALIGGAVGGAIAGADAIVNGTGTSDQKVKQFCELCKNSKAQITQRANQIADAVRDSVQGAGTDEQRIFEALKGISNFDEFCSLVKAYQQSYSTDLYTDLDDDIDSEGEWVVIFRIIRDSLMRQKQSQPQAKPTPQPQQTGKPVAPRQRPTVR